MKDKSKQAPKNQIQVNVAVCFELNSVQKPYASALKHRK